MARFDLNEFSTAIGGSSSVISDFEEIDFRDVEAKSDPVIDYDTFLIYARCENVAERALAIRNVSNLLRTFSVENDRQRIEVIFNVIENVFAKETESELFGTLMEQIPSLYVDFAAVEHLLKRTHELFLNLLVRALEHPRDNIRKSAVGAIDISIERRMLSQESLQNVICPLLLEHCYCPGEYTRFIKDEQRYESVTLLCKIVTTPGALTKKWIFEDFLGKYSMLLQDTAFRVRKVTAKMICVAILGKLAVMFGQNFTEKFAVPFLMFLTEDTAWGVRRSSCEVFVDVANNCTMETKQRKLAPRYVALLGDTSRWVTHVAFQQLGQFIATFSDIDQTGLKIRGGRLVTANYDIVDETEGFDSKNENNGTNAEDDTGLYSELPPDVVLPDSNLGEESGAVTVSSVLQDERCDLNELTSLLDTLALADGTTSRVSVEFGFMDSETGNGVAASCSTHPDLTKLVLVDGVDDDDDGSEGNDEQETSGSDEHQNILEIEDDDIEICFEEALPVNEDDVEAYSDHLYWSAGYLDVDSTSFFAKQSSNDKENVRELRNQSVQQPSDSEIMVPQALLDSFINMVSPNEEQDNELNQHCAQSFPAVVLTLGRNNWPCIMNTYKQLASNMQWRVRHTLALSIHEIAAIIGEEHAGAHLVPVFEQFMKDVEDVKLGLLKHLFDFFKLINPSTRRKLLYVLPNFLHSTADNEHNWRNRHEYIRQCFLLCDLFDMHDVNQHLAAIALTLANDRISDVRKEATVLLTKILGKFVNEEWILQNYTSTPADMLHIPVTNSFVSDIIKGFARSVNWQRRQTFALFCQKSLEREALNCDQFSSLLLNDLLTLAGDPVANVRIAFARALSTTRGGLAFHALRDSSAVRHALEVLLLGDDVECRRAARISLGVPDTENIVNANAYAQRIRETEGNVSNGHYADRIMSFNGTHN